NHTALTASDTPTATTHTLSLHDALPIWRVREHAHRLHRRDLGEGAPRPLVQRSEIRLARTRRRRSSRRRRVRARRISLLCTRGRDRKSTRLNSSHRTISYAVFCLKKKKR